MRDERRQVLADAPSDPYTIDTLELLSKDKIGENLLNVFWKAHFVDRQVKAVFEDIMRNQDKSLVRLLKKKTDGLLSSQIEQSLKRAEVTIDFPTVSTSPAVVPEKPTKKEEKKESTKSKGRHKIPHWLSLSRLIDAGLIKPPLNLEADYKSQRLTAIVQSDGSVVFDGKTYTALSAAGGMARNAVTGPPPDGRPYWPTNGWSFWKYQDHETGKLEKIKLLRKRFLEKQG